MSNDAIMQAAIIEAEEQQGDRKRRKKKLLIILLCLILSIGMVFGVMFAFFSDIFTGSETVTAGTLDIVKGTTSVKQNGVAATSVGDGDSIVENFNPGDVVTITVGVKNNGSKSAWIRGNVKLTGTAMEFAAPDSFSGTFYIFDGTLTQTEAEAQKGSNAVTATYIGDNTYQLADLTPGVINGDNSLADFEAETQTGDLATTTIYNSGDKANEGTITYTIYFDPSANNAWQGKTLTLGYTVEAIQYRNNSSKDWSGLTIVPVE
jgi:hypothetical protein